MKLISSNIILFFSSISLLLLLNYLQICLGASAVSKNERGKYRENETNYGTISSFSVENSHFVPLEGKIRLLKKLNETESLSRVPFDPVYYLRKPFFDRNENVYGKIVRYEE
ncbi:hypothetical protein KQX54_015258 [Cotesia glomerata]|uniref:Uncharacterized protein n=1 Tax=Cotesia glomerata TaxID=32391 RepID=A0AAV7IND6_COTGL|nr:hypothetical protein KQX54_015258 [Cotesia glomerata]